MNERLKKLRKTLDLTQQEFAIRIGSKRNTIAKYETNTNIPSTAVISLICREFNVNELWLRTGEGSMFLPVDRKSEISKFMNQLMQEESNSFKNRLVSVLADLSTAEWEFLEHRLKQLYEGKLAEATTETHNQSTEELEAEYKKSVLNSAQKTDTYTASNTTDGEKDKKVVG